MKGDTSNKKGKKEKGKEGRKKEECYGIFLTSSVGV